jgi:hypothetical protein
VAKLGTGVITPQLSRMQLLVPQDHACFAEAERKLEVGDALVQVVQIYKAASHRVVICD